MTNPLVFWDNWGKKELKLLFAFGVLVILALVIFKFPGLADSEPIQPLSFTLVPSEPTSIYIPAVDIRAHFEEPVGLNDDRQIDVPKGFDTLARYKFAPTPGEMGPAVVLGHLDSLDGPEVFYKLRHLKKGDTIEIERADNKTAVFAVTELSWHRQSGFPTEAVYGDIDHAGLRLVTCSGEFDHGEQRYSHNLIVYASLVKAY